MPFFRLAMSSGVSVNFAVVNMEGFSTPWLWSGNSNPNTVAKRVSPLSWDMIICCFTSLLMLKPQ